MASDRELPPRPPPGRRRAWAIAALGGSAALAVMAAVVVDQVQVRRATAAVATAHAAGRVDEASQALAFWEKRRPSASGPQLWRARIALGEGRTEEAVEHWKEARRRGASGPDAAVLEGALLVRAGRHREAEPLLRAAWERGPAFDPVVAEGLARLYLETFRLGSAREVLERWVQAVPHDAKPWLWRAEIDGRLDDPAPVLRDYREALKRDPGLVGPRLKLAEGLWADGQFDAAEREFTAYLERRPDDAEGWLGAARVSLARADRDEAAQRLARGLERDPKHAALWSERGNLALARNDPEAARADLERAIQLDPHDPEARRRLALALGRLGRTDEAEAALKESRRLNAERAELKAIRDRLTSQPDDREAQVAAARWLIAHDHADEGLRWAQKVLSEDPGNQATHSLLADYYQTQGNMGLANYHRMKVEDK